MSRATISDVARLAGVSKSTVSRVLNGKVDYMRPETQAAVQQAITDLDYQPSSVARSLISRRTHTLALLISDVANPYYADVIRGVEEAAMPLDYNVFLANTDYHVERGRGVLQAFADKRVDGVLIMSSGMSDLWLLDLARQGIPAVVVDWPARQSGGPLGLIAIDFSTGTIQAVEHLIGLGHHRFAYISGPLDLPTSQARLTAFLTAGAEFGLSPDMIPVIEGNLRLNGGKQALDQLQAISPRPTAVICANDLTAIGLAWSASERGLRIPEDFSLVGLDDISLAAETSPALTTIALPGALIGRKAVELLSQILDDLQTGSIESGEIFLSSVIQTKLVIRKSTGEARLG